jgi:predicted dehydrogenase
MKELINIGIIGAGKFSHQHVNAIREIDTFKLVAACRRNEKELAQYCDHYGIKGYVDYQELLNDKTIDAVLIATPHHHHTAVAIQAARAGKHILLEKPFAPNLAECEQINNEAKAAGIVLMLGHTTQFTAAFQATKALLEKEELGSLVQAVGFSNTLWMGPDRKEWHLSKEFGGGYLLTLGVHPISAMLSLVSSPVESVRCSLGTGFHAINTDDYGTLWMNFSNGVVATIIYTGYTRGVLKVESEFYCQRGMIKTNVREGAFIGENDHWTLVPNSQSSAWLHEALVNEWKEFNTSIIDKRQPLVNGDEAIRAMQVIDAAFRSSAENKEIWL